MLSRDADTVSAAGEGNAGKHITDCTCLTVLARLSDCLAPNRMVARLHSSSLVSGWTLSIWFFHDSGPSCGAVVFVILLIECKPVLLCLKAAPEVVRLCGVRRLDGNMDPRCPINNRIRIKSG